MFCDRWVRWGPSVPSGGSQSDQFRSWLPSQSAALDWSVGRGTFVGGRLGTAAVWTEIGMGREIRMMVKQVLVHYHCLSNSLTKCIAINWVSIRPLGSFIKSSIPIQIVAMSESAYIFTAALYTAHKGFYLPSPVCASKPSSPVQQSGTTTHPHSATHSLDSVH